MRTLDETIELLGSIYYNDFKKAKADAVAYLKEYRMQVDDIVAKRKALEYKSKRYDEMCETIQKQGQEREDRLQAEIARYLEAVKNCELAENKYKKLAEEASQNLVNTSQNEPLTWDELREMEGKPVWVEIIGRTIPLDSAWGIATGGSYHTWQGVESWRLVRPGAEYSLPVADYGKTWQAYRKERK